MNQQTIAVGMFLGVLTGQLIDIAQQNFRAPIVYAREPEAPKEVLIGTTYSEETIIRKIKETFPENPERAVAIAECESGLDANAINTKNKNGSTDGGLMQINSTHDKQMEVLGLDKFNVDDNLKFARMLYEKNGFKPWVCNRLIKKV